MGASISMGVSSVWVGMSLCPKARVVIPSSKMYRLVSRGARATVCTVSVNCVFVTTTTGHVTCVNSLLQQAGAVIIMCDGFSQHALLYSLRTLTAVLHGQQCVSSVWV